MQLSEFIVKFETRSREDTNHSLAELRKDLVTEFLFILQYRKFSRKERAC